MPVHDWTRVDAGLFHDFHLSWTVTLCKALNTGGLPRDYFALLELPALSSRSRLIRRNEATLYAARADHITVRDQGGVVVAVIEIVSPGNKSSLAEFRALVEKSAEFLRQGIHLLIIDLFPPSKCDPQGIHKALWDEFEDEDFELPPDKPLTLAAYDAGPPRVAYVELVAVGDVLPAMPLFLKPESYVPAPLEETYQAAWAMFPAPMKRLLEGPAAEPPAGS